MTVCHSLNELNEITHQELTSIIRDDEQFLIAVTADDGIRPSYHTRLVLTDERFLTIRHAPLTQEVSRHSLHTLSNVNLTDFSRCNLRIQTTSNGTLEYPVTPEFGEKFVNEIQETLAHVQPSRRARLIKYLHMDRELSIATGVVALFTGLIVLALQSIFPITFTMSI